MNLYDVAFDGEHLFVAAKDFGEAQMRWVEHQRGNDWNTPDSPESIILLADEDSILWPAADPSSVHQCRECGGVIVDGVIIKAEGEEPECSRCGGPIRFQPVFQKASAT